jgi:AbrB family looped-hinge helix DNA binding protein
MLISTKGQVTIPAEIRRKAGLLPNTEVEFVFDDQQRVMLVPKEGVKGRGERVVAHLRKFRSKLIMSPEEIMRLTRGED